MGNRLSKYKGVTKKRDDWQAQITHNGKTEYIGTFPTETSAAIAFNERAKELGISKEYLNPLPGDKDYGRRTAFDLRRGGKEGRFDPVYNHSSKYKGVFWSEAWGCWAVDINRHDFRYQNRFGSQDSDEIEAALDYNNAMIERYGDKAKHLNVILDSTK